MQEPREIQLESQHQFQISNLTIDVGLMGQSHEFSYRGATVTVKLPSRADVGDPSDRFASAYPHMHRKVGDELELLAVDIAAVQVNVALDEKIALVPEVLNRIPNATDLIPEADCARLMDIGIRANNTASNAFEYWITVLRWQCDNPNVGRPVSGPVMIYQNHLLDTNSKSRVWLMPNGVQVYMSKMLTEKQWITAQTFLQSGEDVPVYNLLLDDARYYRTRYEFRRSIIDLAIACEVFIRTIVLRTLPPTLDADMRDYIDDANINQYRHKYLFNLLSDEGKAALEKLNKSSLNSLFALRNDIMHRADDGRATVENCDRYIGATRRLFEIGEQMLANPPTTE
jgi:hypothetical protein